MKKILSIICTFVLLVSLSACESKNGNANGNSSVNEFKESCTFVTYDELARNTGALRGSHIAITGKVFQVTESWGSRIYMVNMSTGTNYGQHVFVTSSNKDSIVLENDYVTIYGIAAGTQTYVTVLGAQRTIPKVNAKYIILGHPSSSVPSYEETPVPVIP